MRKFAPFVCFVLCFVLILSACSNNGQKEASKEAKKEDTKETASEREFEGEKGKIKLPANPERIVVAVQDYVGDVLALGMKPVGIAGWIAETSPYHKDQIQGIENVGETREVSTKKVLSLNPDIILTYEEGLYEELSKIAPTIYIPLEYDFRKRLTEIGKVLNKEDEAKEWIKAFDKKAEEKKTELFSKIDQNTKVAIVELSQKEIYLMGKTYGRGGQIIYNVLGLHAPKRVEEEAFEKGWASISQEAIPDILGEADHIFLGVRSNASAEENGGDSAEKAITSSSLWNNLPAVKNGNVHNYSVDAFYYSDAVALNKQIDEIVEMLTSK